jgi:hypothetical protein
MEMEQQLPKLIKVKRKNRICFIRLKFMFDDGKIKILFLERATSRRVGYPRK